MIRFWPCKKKDEPLPETLAEARERLTGRVQEFNDNYYDNLCKMLQDYIEKRNKPEEKKMKKEEARKSAEKLQDSIDVPTYVEPDHRCFFVRLQSGNTPLAKFPYTSEPPPIKEGVLCVGETCVSSETILGYSSGSFDYDGDLMVNISDFTTGLYRNKSIPLKNARPVTPADLVRWGWEEPKECSDCKHDAYGYDPHGDEPCASCCKSSKNRPNFEPAR